MANKKLKVLTYNPKNGRNCFLPAKEKTVHTDHGKMYRCKAKSGHAISVTDDHSLATVGVDDLFNELEPQNALGKLVPIPFKIDYESFAGIHVQNAMVDNMYSPIPVLKTELLQCSEYIVDSFLILFFAAYNDVYKYADEYELELLKILCARVGIYYTYTDTEFKVDFNCYGYVPEKTEEGTIVLVDRYAARETNPYRNLPYTWSEVVSVEEIEREATTYDFTIDVFPLFIANSILVYDTMQVHLPITEEARQEALDKMLPSKNLFAVRTLDPMMLPQQESVFGLYKASQPVGDSITVHDIAEVKAALDKGTYKPNQAVNYMGHNTTAGMVLVNELLPPELRDYKSVWNGGVMKGILAKLGRSHPNLYTKAADGFKDYGSHFAYYLGASFSAKDFDLHDLKQQRDAVFNEVTKKMKATNSYEEKTKLLRDAQSVSQKLTDNATYNAFNQWAYSGSKGSKSQVMQIISSPTAVADPRDRLIPMLISKSYNEGLSPADYWVSSYGTRKGTVGAKLSVAPGGALAKEIVGNVLDIVVSERDCGTKEGITLPISDRKDVLDRYTAGTNKLVDATVLENLTKQGITSITVRSPMKCKAKHGVCQMCYGHNERGKLVEIGENVGVQAAQAITEPLTQMGLSSKHTAGTAAEDKVGLSTVQRFFTMPNQYSGAALIAANSGVVTKIEEAPAGGYDIFVGTKKHHSVPGRAIYVKVGDQVHAGDILTNGVPNLKKIVPHKGIDFSRNLFVDHASDLYSRAGAPSVRKNFETVARGLINYVEITDPGDFHEYVIGDVVDYNKLQAELKEPENANRKHPIFHPIQKGTTYAPQDKPDWLANFGFKYLKKNFIENAAMGVKSDIHSYHPIAGYAIGKEFGEGKDGKY